MVALLSRFVIPAKEGIRTGVVRWIPAFAGMTNVGLGMTRLGLAMTNVGLEIEKVSERDYRPSRSS